LSGEKSQKRTVTVWFILPWVIFILVLWLALMRDKPVLFSTFVDLQNATDSELISLDKKRAISENVKNKFNFPKYYKGNNNVGILLIHGFTASPYEMKDLAEFLNGYGFSVYNARVAGHGSTPENLNKLTLEDWYESLKYGYFVLKNNNRQIFIIGQSAGALLAQIVSEYNKSDGMILLSPAISLKNFFFYTIPFTKYFLNTLKKAHFKEEMRNYYYDVYPVKGLYQLYLLINYVKKNIREIKKPTLVLQSVFDKTVNSEGVIGFYEGLKGDDKKVIVLKDNKKVNHVLTNDLNPEKEKVFEIILQWLKEKTNV
jgi:carboxylesterase